VIALRRAPERQRELNGGLAIWRAFDLERGGTDVLAGGFGALENLSEGSIAPGGNAWSFGSRDSEFVTYVADGVVARSDPETRPRLMQAGEFGHLAVGRGSQLSEANASPAISARVFRLRFTSPAPRGVRQCDGRRFTAAERRGHLRVVASPDGRQGSLLMGQSVLVFSALLDPGHHVVHALLPGRMAWLHVVCGSGMLGDLLLSEGDGVGFADERAVAFTAEDVAELLLVDLPDEALPPRGATLQP